MREVGSGSTRGRRFLAGAAMTLAAWFVAFLIVLALLAAFGAQLEALPIVLNALVFTGVLVPVMGNVVMPVVGAGVARWVAAPTAPPRPEGPIEATAHPQLTVLPVWPITTIGVLVTVDSGPYAIPVSAPLRVEDRRILLSLHRDRGSLSRLRARPQVALIILCTGDIAVTARGEARIVQEPMANAPEYVAVAIEVEHVDDHRQPEFLVESGIDRRWVDLDAQQALHERVEALATQDCDTS